MGDLSRYNQENSSRINRAGRTFRRDPAETERRVPAAAAMGAEGIIHGGFGARTGLPPSATECDTVARVLQASARRAISKGVSFLCGNARRYRLI